VLPTLHPIINNEMLHFFSLHYPVLILALPLTI
jgi:hypothetical protein